MKKDRLEVSVWKHDSQVRNVEGTGVINRSHCARKFKINEKLSKTKKNSKINISQQFSYKVSYFVPYGTL